MEKSGSNTSIPLVLEKTAELHANMSLVHRVLSHIAVFMVVTLISTMSGVFIEHQVFRYNESTEDDMIQNMALFLIVYPIWSFCIVTTLVYLIISWKTVPGYLPNEFKTPLTEEGFAPVPLLRLYNMRSWLANGLYTFDELCDNQSQKDEVPVKTTPDKIIDITKLTALEQKVYDMSNKDWCQIEIKMVHFMPYKAWKHMNWNYCWKCKAIRPPRSHHCSKCNICVLRMDHHCWWIGNCVGIQNHKVFLIFTIFAWLGSTITAIMLTCQLSILSNFETFDWYTAHGVTVGICCILIQSLGWILVAQYRTIRSNRSFIEKTDLKNGNPFNIKENDKNGNVHELLGKDWFNFGQQIPEIDGINYQMRKVGVAVSCCKNDKKKD